jgi:hypothetical protein
MDQLALVRTRRLQNLNQHVRTGVSCSFALSIRACVVKATKKFRNSKIHGQHASAHAWQPKHAVLAAAARFDVVHILQKRHRPPFRGISTGDLSRGVHDAEAINWFLINNVCFAP